MCDVYLGQINEAAGFDSGVYFCGRILFDLCALFVGDRKFIDKIFKTFRA